MKRSLAVITLNEEDNIGRCLSSVPDDFEKIVVDSGSSDSTCRIARENGAEVFTRSFEGYSSQWRYAIERTTGDWILVLAADENLNTELRNAISVLEPDESAYKLHRRTYYMGRLLRFGPWMGETTLRFWKRGSVRVSDRSVHEEFIPMESPGLVRSGCIEHRSYRSVSEHMERMNRYCSLWADDMLTQGRRSHYLSLVLRPSARLFSAYFLRGGFLEGAPGLVASATSAYYVFLKWAMLMERQRNV